MTVFGDGAVLSADQPTVCGKCASRYLYVDYSPPGEPRELSCVNCGWRWTEPRRQLDQPRIYELTRSEPKPHQRRARYSRLWDTADLDELRRLRGLGLNVGELALRLRRGRPTILAMLRELGVEV